MCNETCASMHMGQGSYVLVHLLCTEGAAQSHNPLLKETFPQQTLKVTLANSTSLITTCFNSR